MTAQLAARKPLPQPFGPGSFRFITNALSAEQAENGPRRFRAIASSSVTDLAGNTISLNALNQMRDDFRAGLPIFMDHVHDNVVDSTFGMSDTAEVYDSGERDADGNAIYDLHIGGRVNEPNPRAVQLHNSIIGGYVKFGASIGAIVKEHKRDPKTGGLLIEGLSAKEASIVGIGKNQRAWVYKAALAAESLDTDEAYEDEVEEPPKVFEATVDELASLGEAIQLGEAGPEILTAAASCPECNHGGACNCTDCDCSHASHHMQNSAEPDFTAQEVLEDAPEPAPEGGQESEDAETPETAPAETEETDPEVEARQVMNVEEADVVSLLAHVRSLVEAIGELREENATLKAQIAEKSAVAAEVEDTRMVVARLMEMPLQRRAVVDLTATIDRFPMLDPRISGYLNRTEE